MISYRVEETIGRSRSDVVEYDADIGRHAEWAGSPGLPGVRRFLERFTAGEVQRGEAGAVRRHKERLETTPAAGPA